MTAAQPEESLPPKLGFGTALAIVVAQSFAFRVLLDAALGSTPGAAAGLAILFGTPLLTIVFARQLWRWVHHQAICDARGGGSAAKVAPGRPSTELRAAVIAVEAANPLQPAHDPTPRPTIAPAGAPDAPFLARCADASAALAAEFAAAIDDAQRAAMAEQLCENFQLRWAGPATARRASLLAAEVPPSFDAAARALRGLALRFAASAAPLAEGAFAWNVPPLRAGGEAAVGRALRAWTEATSSAADSALFSSTGFWISPYGAHVVGALALLFSFLELVAVANGKYLIHPADWVAHLCFALGFAVVAALLRAGRREPARWAWAATLVAAAACWATEAALSSCKCAGPYAETHTAGGDPTLRDYPWQWAWMVAVAAPTALGMAGVSTHPHRTFDILFVFLPCMCVLMGTPMAATDYQHFKGRSEIGVGPFALLNNFSSVAVLAPAFAGIGTYLWAGRTRALAKARRMAAEDAARYTRLWEQQLLPAAGFREALRSLEEGAWREVQENALRLPKRQLSAPSLYALLMQADELNDLLQAKLHDVCAAHGGEHHACGVKGETRALQKVFRSYRGDWRRLGDLCRTSLVFETIPQIEACLRAIGTDAELQVVRAGDVKMRLREGFDAAALSGGYRDIQLCVRLDSAEARARGVHEHLCEVQLHFAPIVALKSGGGHKNYVLCRNLGGK